MMAISHLSAKDITQKPRHTQSEPLMEILPVLDKNRRHKLDLNILLRMPNNISQGK